MKPNYCLPIIGIKKDVVLDTIKESEGYQFYEIWLDYIEDLDYDFINDVLQAFPGQIIFVFRRQNLETPVMDPQKRFSIISSLATHDALIDLDVVTQQEELAYIVEHGLKMKLITSYHNYQKTPEDNKLIEVMAVMMNYKPYIIKIATKCIEPKDGLRLLDLLLSLKKEQKRYIILGMGEYGTITRLYGTLWGNELTFAPIKKEAATAPGQLTKQEMETMLKILGNNS